MKAWTKIENGFVLAMLAILFLAAGCPVIESGTAAGPQQEGDAEEVPRKVIRMEDAIYEPNVRTVQFYRGRDPFSYPIIYLGDPTPLILEFDLLQPDDVPIDDFFVEVINCDHDWTPSNLLSLEYLDGFASDRMYDYDRSRNTRIPYVHYRYTFPAENSGFKRSGNYVLKVSRSNSSEDILLTRRLVVVQKKVGVEPKIGQSKFATDRRKLQRVDFNVHLSGRLRQMFDPRQDLKVVLLQNFRWDNAQTGLQPLFITDQKLEYSFDAGREFQGGNEYRMLDIRTMRFLTEKMKTVNDRDSIYHVGLYPEKPRMRNTYFSKPDLNGNYVIEVQEYPDDDLEADYVLARFGLQYPEPLRDADVYVFGKFNDWTCTEESKMAYNASNYRYETELLLKQGVYDYAYAVKKRGSTVVDEAVMEGSHFETENYYTILVYFKPPGARSAELVGLSHVNFYD